jgi:hypothetical protein
MDSLRAPDGDARRTGIRIFLEKKLLPVRSSTYPLILSDRNSITWSLGLSLAYRGSETSRDRVETYYMLK